VPILAAAVAVVGALGVVNLLLSFGVIRRLREQGEALASVATSDPPVTALETGDQPAACSAVTAAGELLTDVTGLDMVAFFSSTCSACPERVPAFAEFLGRHRVPGDRVLAVVLGSPAEPPPYAPALAGLAHLCYEQEDGELAKAFAIVGYPAFLLLTAGTVAAVNWDPAALPEPARAAR
jgi:thiol-disulfide isomerase/thioredoxin